MANPTVTIEIKEVGSQKVLTQMGKVNVAARKLTTTKKRLAKQADKNSISNKKLTKNTTQLSTSMRNLGSAAVFAVGPLSGLGARLIAFQAIASRSTVSIAAFAAGLAAFTVVAVKLIGASIRASLAIAKIHSALVVATGSSFAARDAFEFLTETSLELGLSLESSAQQFAQLAAAAKGTSLEGEGVRKIFLGASKAAVALGLSVDQTTGIFRALQQMISKGTVQAEELRGQLGERLPGAFQIAAIAMGVTTSELGKMLKLGEVMAEDLLPKLGEAFEKRFGEQAKIASTNLRGAINKLSTATFLFSKSLDETILSGRAAANVLDTLSTIILSLTNNMSILVSSLGAAAAASLVLVGPSILGGIKKLITLVKGLTTATVALDVALTASGIGFALKIAKWAVAAGVAAVAFFALKESLEQTSESQVELIAHLRDYIDVVKEADGATRASVTEQIRLAEIGIKTTIASVTAARLAARSLADIAEASGRKQFRGNSTVRSAGAVSASVEARQKAERLEEALQVLLGLLGELQGLKIVAIEEEASKSLDKLLIQVDALERLNAARLQGVEALKEETFQLALEKQIRKDSIGGMEGQIAALTKVMRAMQSAKDVSEALTKAEEASLRAFKAQEAARKKVAILQEKGEKELESIKASNEVLKLRIKGLEKEARLMEIRNRLEAEYGGEHLRKTREELEKQILLQDKLNNKLKETDELKDILKEGFRELGATIASSIREGINLFESLLNVLNNVLEKIVELIAQQIFIDPLLKSLKLGGESTGGGDALGSIIKFGASLFSGGGLGAGVSPTGGDIAGTPFAHGGSFNVKGKGGVDANFVPLALTAGENVKITPAGAQGGDKTTIINLYLPPGMTAREFGDSDGQIGTLVAGTISAAAASNN